MEYSYFLSPDASFATGGTYPKATTASAYELQSTGLLTLETSDIFTGAVPTTNGIPADTETGGRMLVGFSETFTP
jgi:hypothetical protein